MSAEKIWVDTTYKVGEADSKGNYIQVTADEESCGLRLSNGGPNNNYFGQADITMSKDMAKKLGEILIKFSNEVI